MLKQPHRLEQLLESHLAGNPVDVPEPHQAEFEQAVAAHRVLQEFLAETCLPDETPGDRVPPDVSRNYEIERELGRGGMGVVYLARQRSLDRQVALKVLRPGEHAFGSILKRFREEAQHLARLRHPHIVSIHEVGEAGGEPYFTMDYIDGEPLSAVIARGPLAPTQAVALLKQICAAVQHAHRQGIIHRDLKPGNVLLESGAHVYVTDFGLARDMTRESTITQSGELLGTPQYMAPEQARGETSLVGEATDIHAMGLLLFEMLTGKSPFASRSPADVLVKLLNEVPPPLRTLDRRIPRDLETICQKMLQKSPAARYANVSALLEDLRRYEAGEPLIARRPSLPVQWARRAARHWKLVATALITAAIMATVVPRMFDPSFDELVAWGDEELATGRPEVAAEVYSRAFDRASGAQQQSIAERIVRTCRELDDGKAVTDLALRVIELVPDASFGDHDYLVAQALLMRERAKSPDGTLDIFRGRPDDQLRLVKARLELAHASNLTDQQRLEIEESLAAVNLVLSEQKPWVRMEPEYLSRVPGGSTAELTAQRNDESQSPWNRGRAAVALARRFEADADSAQAIAHWRRALELMRSVYPMYGGVKAAIGSKPSRVDAPDADECLLVREVVENIQRLAPGSMATPQGGIEFDVVGYSLPASIGMDLAIVLSDPEIARPDEGLPHYLPRLVPVRQDAPVSVQVLDGTYRLQYRGHHGRWDDSTGNLPRLLQVDVDDWPEQIVVQGGTIRLPPVRLRLADEITLTSPENGASANLADLTLSWRPVTGAARYQVSLMYTSETPTPTTHFFSTVSTDSPKLRLTELTEFEKAQVRRELIAGRTGGWRVDAYDANDRRIGVALEERRFLVAGELPPESPEQSPRTANPGP